ncbi:MAG: potassium channel family protein [Ilumatobacteraceae bacterium]
MASGAPPAGRASAATGAPATALVWLASVAKPVVRILFPSRAADPLRSLAMRVGVAVGLLLVVALITWVGRDGYRDADGDPVTLLDAIYYASVSVTTTGYGDITPISPGSRALTAFLVTPARVLFLIVLVGTTIEVLTERFREALAVSRWRKHVTNHVIVVGYGTKGRGAVQTLIDGGTVDRAELVVIDAGGDAVEEARAAGLTAIHGDATRTSVLRQARASEARTVIVTTHRDDTATLVTLTARELSPTAVIVAAVRETENAHLLSQSGANTVIVSAEAAGRLLGLATEEPRAVAVIEDLLVAGRGLRLTERPATASEHGGPPGVVDGCLPVAVVRDGVRIAFDEDGFDRIQPGDIIIGLVSEA